MTSKLLSSVGSLGSLGNLGNLGSLGSLGSQTNPSPKIFSSGLATETGSVDFTKIGQMQDLLPKSSRLALGASSIIMYLLGIATILSNAVMSTIVYTQLKGYSDYSQNKQLQNSYSISLGIMVTLWIVFSLVLISSLAIIPINNNPYFNVLFLTIFSILNIAVLITSIIILINVNSSSDSNGSVNSSLIGMIILSSIMTIIFIIYSIYSIIKYRKIGGLTQDIETVKNVITVL
jgi:hypothetical protein